MSYGWDMTVTYRDPERAPEVFHSALVNDTIAAVAVISQQTDSPGGKRVTRIPWDLIERIVTAT